MKLNLKKITYRFHITATSVLLCTFLLGGCGEERPFTYHYSSPQQVVIKYKGQDFQLNMSTPNKKVPFTYEFERDGDLNINIEGKNYEIDSPYDHDKKKAKKKAKKKVNKSKQTKR